MGRQYRARSDQVRHARVAAHEGGADLSPDRQPCALFQMLLGHARIESTVGYLGIEVDDAIEIAEKIDI